MDSKTSRPLFAWLRSLELDIIVLQEHNIVSDAAAHEIAADWLRSCNITSSLCQRLAEHFVFLCKPVGAAGGVLVLLNPDQIDLAV